MKVLILGSTGRTGKRVLKYALEQGAQVNVLSRNSGRIKAHQNLNIFEGDTTNSEDIRKAMEGCEYVISILNVSRKSDIPWAPLRTPKTFLSETMKTVIPIAEELQIKRLVICSAWGVAETLQDIPWWFKWTIQNSNIQAAYSDHERQEELVEQSALDWCIVRPAGLTNFSDANIRESMANEPKPGILISRNSVARYLYESTTHPDRSKKKIVISKA